ncbi:MAG TPA: sigma-70 family RNA polymerase sigma factor [Rhizomicrobium sp.]|nr:sigma-70 family RNA polymerase sigma factor [Rhizomicrobium sp.]
MSLEEPLPAEALALIAQAGSGDRRAMEQLIVHYQQRIARFVIVQTKDDVHYEDLCQKVFVKMVLSLPRLRAPEHFEGWLFQIARNVCRDHLRARTGWRRLFTAFEPLHETVASPEQQPDRSAAMEAQIGQLPPPQREALRLSLEAPRSYEEMARLSHSSVSAVKSRLHRARENLRALLLARDAE